MTTPTSKQLVSPSTRSQSSIPLDSMRQQTQKVNSTQKTHLVSPKRTGLISRQEMAPNCPSRNRRGLKRYPVEGSICPSIEALIRKGRAFLGTRSPFRSRRLCGFMPAAKRGTPRSRPIPGIRQGQRVGKAVAHASGCAERSKGPSAWENDQYGTKAGLSRQLASQTEFKDPSVRKAKDHTPKDSPIHDH